jgi:hypothetical protein
VSQNKGGPQRPGGSLIANLRAGSYGPFERASKVLSNIGRKVVRREACCGNYGDPGC